ncbi:metal ABC transporter substrate-binding protein [Micrococcoides hystricis]|uniref:Metal ABC transporter substrate-binding protein n=1 Tax=Micrococcoides hystricis TaxID=1572761 RepID=A0ABV6PBM1_9MICC
MITHSRSAVSRLITGVIAALALLLSGCAVNEDGAPQRAADEPLTVFATTMYLADAVKRIAPDVEVTTMVGPGADPHTYQLSTKDIERLNSADVVLWNGLHLEAVAGKVLAEQGDRQLAVAEQLPTDDLIKAGDDDDFGGMYDPHVWNDPDLWSQVVEFSAEFLGKHDPDNAEQYLQNAKEFQQDIAELDAKAQKQLDTIPEDRRVVITGHDAFNYLGRAYNLEIRATDFISTEAELSAAELSELADVIAEHEIPVIFQDNQKNPQAITSLKEAVTARGGAVEVSSEELFADSMGPEAPVDTYLGAFAHNVETIAEALGETE